MRVAVYYAPRPDDCLHRDASCWLGRDAATGTPTTQPDIPGIAEVTAEPRLYGFHATLKPPMRLADGVSWDDVLQSADALARRLTAFDLPPLAVSDVHGFVALRETVASPPLQ